jgi:regulator of sigma E protease
MVMFSNIIRSAADVVVLVCLFGITILIHELGHFLLALKFGLRIETFSIGFGPAIWKRSWRGILFKIGCIPVGGYVSLPQLDPSGMSTLQGQGGDGEGLPHVAPWKKMIVSVAGASGNMLFAVGLAWLIYLVPGARTGDSEAGTLVGHVATNSTAYAAGLRPGDDIVAVNGENVSSWNEFTVLTVLHGGEDRPVDLTVRRDERLRLLSVPTVEGEMGVRQVEGILKSTLCLVQDVVPGGSAQEAGVQAGDIVRTIDGITVASTEHFIRLVAERADRDCVLVVEREGKPQTLTVRPRFDEDRGRALIGVSVSAGFEAGVMPWMQHRNPWAQIRGDAMGIVRTLRALVTPREAKQAARGLGGPIMIIAALWVSIKISILNAVGFLRFLNVNLAILNLLPIPVLDGGHIVFSLWEAVTRRRMSPRFVSVLVNVFAAILIGLLVLLSLRDVLRAPRLLRAFYGGDDEPVELVTNAPPAEAASTNGPSPVRDAPDAP